MFGMFNTASRRLTIWYVACIMALCLAFSVWVYQEATKELRLAFDDKVMLYLNGPGGERIIERQIDTGRQRILLNLVYLNAFVFVTSSISSYFLARRTLQPIEDAVEAQNRFTADASHELRTPLASMKTELEVALRDPKLSKTEMRELLKSNVEEIDRMTSLTQGLLTLARPQSDAALHSVRIDDPVRDAVEQMRPLAAAKPLTIKDQLSEVHAKADPALLNQVVCILLDNAIKYSPQKSEITVRLENENSYAVITVADQGPGIDSKDVPSIFDRFYRADASRSAANTPGHGLGLSIAHKLVVNMRGSIDVQSTQGAVFTVRLPR